MKMFLRETKDNLVFIMILENFFFSSREPPTPTLWQNRMEEEQSKTELTEYLFLILPGNLTANVIPYQEIWHKGPNFSIKLPQILIF